MRVLGISCGNGVIVYPFKKYLVAGIEGRSIFKTPGNIQWKSNFGGIPLFYDFKSYQRWAEGDACGEEQLDLVIGAPDCGHSSILALSRSKKYSNPRSNLSLREFLEAVRILKPKVFMMENLEKLLDTMSKEELSAYFEEYRLIFHIGSVMNWGNSQKNRVRMVIIGVNKDSNLLPRFFKSVYKVKRPKFTAELTKGLIYGQNGHFREDINTPITIYAGCKITAKEIRDEWLKNNWTRWQVTGRNFSTAPGVYRNTPDTYPNTARKANRQYNPEGLMMSPRELARIMGVPDRFVIYYEEEKSNYWINKGRVTATKTCPMEIPIWLLRQMRRAINYAESV